jgi:hypothetical protein
MCRRQIVNEKQPKLKYTSLKMYGFNLFIQNGYKEQNDKVKDGRAKPIGSPCGF